MSLFETRFLGARLRLRAPSHEAAEALAYYLALEGLDPVEGAKGAGPLLDLGGAPGSFRDAPEGLSGLLLEAVHGLARVLADRFWFLHGCGLVVRGEAVVLTGGSGSGKTTLAMVAEHLGYPTLGEDLVVVAWASGRVHALAMPFRPRPFTRELLAGWYEAQGGSWSENAPLRPRAVEGAFPLARLVLLGAGDGTAAQAVFQNTFGRQDLDPALLLSRIARALAKCRVERAPRVCLAPGLTAPQAREALDQWLIAPQNPCPRALFDSAS